MQNKLHLYTKGKLKLKSKLLHLYIIKIIKCFIAHLMLQDLCYTDVTQCYRTLLKEIMKNINERLSVFSQNIVVMFFDIILVYKNRPTVSQFLFDKTYSFVIHILLQVVHVKKNKR